MKSTTAQAIFETGKVTNAFVVINIFLVDIRVLHVKRTSITDISLDDGGGEIG
jgi:hypothetical protein